MSLAEEIADELSKINGQADDYAQAAFNVLRALNTLGYNVVKVKSDWTCFCGHRNRAEAMSCSRCQRTPKESDTAKFLIAQRYYN